MTVRHTLGLLKRAVMTGINDARHPPWRPAGHYYSPMPSADDVRRALERPAVVDVLDVDLREEAQVALVAELGMAIPDEGRWVDGNGMFDRSDAAVLDAMLRRLRPTKIVEVGSGHSTALILDVAEREDLGLEVVCIEPHADRLNSVLRPGDERRLTLIEMQAQGIPVDELVGKVGPGDVLFIDSTHVVKIGSDVCFLLLEVLPRLPVGAVVHVHDIFWPFEYPDGWVREGRAWTEVYLLRAFLMNNDAWEILLFTSWFWKAHADLVPQNLRDFSPGSIWLRRKA